MGCFGCCRKLEPTTKNGTLSASDESKIACFPSSSDYVAEQVKDGASATATTPHANSYEPKQGKPLPVRECNKLMRSTVLGLVKVRVEEGEMLVRANYNVTLSLGLQSFLSRTCVRTRTPKFETENNLVISKGSPNILHLTVHRVRALDVFSHDPVGFLTIDLSKYFQQPDMNQPIGSKLMEDWVDLHSLHDVNGVTNGPETPSVDDPSFDDSVDEPATGRLKVSVRTTTVKELEADFWARILNLADHDASGTLEYEEFESLLRSMIGDEDLPPNMIQELWNEAEVLANTPGHVDSVTLSHLLTEKRYHNGFHLMRHCPITGEELCPDDDFGNIVTMTLALDGGLGSNLQGGFRTSAQANRSWMMQMSEWVTHPLAGSMSSVYKGNSYETGLNVGANASHIVVYDRKKQVLIEEVISPAIVLAMRNMYQSRMGRLMKATGMFKLLKKMSEDKGIQMDDPASVSEIPRFLKTFKHQIDIADIAEPIESFKTFNEFFYRKLKPEARPIAAGPLVLASAADCRLMAFESIDEATLFWVKGKKFSIRGLLADQYNSQSQPYTHGSLLIFRLAPQDYHRFHSPCDGCIVSIVDVPGQLYTVNPIAVNSVFCDVLTENKRSIITMDSPEFGIVKFVTIGATLVGSICLTVKVGQTVAKGGELGYFAFGGSTCIALFEPLKVVMDSDLVNMSRKSIESHVRMGERIGKAPGSSDVIAPPDGETLPPPINRQAIKFVEHMLTMRERREEKILHLEEAVSDDESAFMMSPAVPRLGRTVSDVPTCSRTAPLPSPVQTPSRTPNMSPMRGAYLTPERPNKRIADKWKKTADGAFYESLGKTGMISMSLFG